MKDYTLNWFDDKGQPIKMHQRLITAGETHSGDYVIYNDLAFYALGDSRFQGNYNGYWNGAPNKRFSLPENTPVIVITY